MGYDFSCVSDAPLRARQNCVRVTRSATGDRRRVGQRKRPLHFASLTLAGADRWADCDPKLSLAPKETRRWAAKKSTARPGCVAI